MKNKLKNIILSLIVTAVIVGGVIVNFSDPQPIGMTFEEYETLIKIYNYEIKKAGGKIKLENATKNNMVTLLNAKLLNTEVPESVSIENEILTRKDYLLLKSGLFKKAEQ